MYTSAYENNDYRGLNTRPYELPINDMFKALSAQTEYWNQGALKVRNAYDNALNLPLTLSSNKELKENYMEEVDGKIQQLSSQDLSDYNVQKAGLNLFAPLLQDPSIQYDSAITSKLQSIYQEANSYKTKKSSKNDIAGEGFNQGNLNYSLKDFDGFNSNLARDPDNLKSIYQKIVNSQYIPYYNPQNDIQVSVKNCGRGSTDKVIPSTQSDEQTLSYSLISKGGADENQMRDCILAGMSDKGWQQIAINSWNKFGNNPQTLAKTYMENSQQISDSLNAGVNKNQATIDLLSNPKLQLTDAQKIELANAKQLQSYYTSQLSDLNNNIKRYKSGDFDYFKDNYDGIATSLGSSIFLNENAKAWANPISKFHIITDNAALSAYNWKNKFSEDAQKFNYQIQLEEQKHKNKLIEDALGGNGKGISDYELGPDGQLRLKQIYPWTSTSDNNDISSPKYYDETLTNQHELAGQITNEFNNLAIKLKNIVPDFSLNSYKELTNDSQLMDYNNDGVINQQDILDYMSNVVKSLNKNNLTDSQLNLNPKLKSAIDLFNETTVRVTNLANKWSIQHGQLQSVNNNSEIQKLSIPNNKQLLNEFININGQVITGQDIIDSLNEESGKLIIKNTLPPASTNLSTGQIVYSPLIPITTFYDHNGNIIDSGGLRTLFNKVRDSELTRVNNFNSKRNELMGQFVKNTREIASGARPMEERGFAQQVVDGSPNYVANILHYTGGQNGKVTFTIGQPINSGSTSDEKANAIGKLVMFNKKDIETDKANTQLYNNLQAKFGGSNVKINDDGTVTVNGPIVDDYFGKIGLQGNQSSYKTDFQNAVNMAQQNVSTPVGKSIIYSPLQFINNQGNAVKIDIIKDYGGLHYELSYSKNGMRNYGHPTIFNTSEQVISFMDTNKF